MNNSDSDHGAVNGKLALELKLDSVVSIHDQIVAYFSEEISSGRIGSGDRLSSENALAKQLNISRMTVRRAFDTLVYAGFLARRQGKGTFVAADAFQEIWPWWA